MRHMGDPRLGTPALGDIGSRDKEGRVVAERDTAPIGQDFDLAAVGLEMPPVAAVVMLVADLPERLGMAIPFVLRPNLPQRHREELFSTESVMLDRSIIDA